MVHADVYEDDLLIDIFWCLNMPSQTMFDLYYGIYFNKRNISYFQFSILLSKHQRLSLMKTSSFTHGHSVKLLCSVLFCEETEIEDYRNQWGGMQCSKIRNLLIL